MKTIHQILLELAAAGKPIQAAQLYRYFRRFNIKPASSAKLRPALYRETTAQDILSSLGLNDQAEAGIGQAEAGQAEDGQARGQARARARWAALKALKAHQAQRQTVAERGKV